ncbi:hypothetical protein ABK040_011589 [Willaertia magna]
MSFSAIQQIIADGNVGKYKSQIESFSNINATDDQGNSLAHYAAAYKRMEILKDLLENRNINTEIKNKLGKTVWDLINEACQSDMSYFEVKQYLKQKLGK